MMQKPLSMTIEEKEEKEEPNASPKIIVLRNHPLLHALSHALFHVGERCAYIWAHHTAQKIYNIIFIVQGVLIC